MKYKNVDLFAAMLYNCKELKGEDMKLKETVLKICKSKTFSVILCALWVMLIFSNSMKPAAQSSAQSDAVAKAIETVIKNTVGAETDLDSLITTIRKSAHFGEFFILGLLCFYAKFNITKIALGYFSQSLLFGACIALFDETLQYGFSGRSPEVRDVWIDLLGFILATAIVAVTVLLMTRKRKKKFPQ